MRYTAGVDCWPGHGSLRCYVRRGGCNLVDGFPKSEGSCLLLVGSYRLMRGGTLVQAALESRSSQCGVSLGS
jgi:hypothetical protein